MAPGHHESHPPEVSRVERQTDWDGRARCRLCSDNTGHDHAWCAAARGLVCDTCCEEILSGEAARLHAATRSEARTIEPLEILVSCAACPRADRVLLDDDEVPGDEAQLH